MEKEVKGREKEREREKGKRKKEERKRKKERIKRKRERELKRPSSKIVFAQKGTNGSDARRERKSVA